MYTLDSVIALVLILSALLASALFVYAMRWLAFGLRFMLTGIISPVVVLGFGLSTAFSLNEIKKIDVFLVETHNTLLTLEKHTCPCVMELYRADIIRYNLELASLKNVTGFKRKLHDDRVFTYTRFNLISE